MVRFMDLCFSFQEIRCDQRQRTHDNQLRSREDLPWGTNRRTDNTLIGRFCQRPPESALGRENRDKTICTQCHGAESVLGLSSGRTKQHRSGVWTNVVPCQLR